VSKLGHSGVIEAMTGLLGLKISQGSFGFDVFVAAPVMAKINEAVVCPREGAIKATLTCHPALVPFRVFGSSYGTSADAREKISFVAESTGQNDGRRGFIAKAQRAIQKRNNWPKRPDDVLLKEMKQVLRKEGSCTGRWGSLARIGRPVPPGW